MILSSAYVSTVVFVLQRQDTEKAQAYVISIRLQSISKVEKEGGLCGISPV